MVNDVVPSRWRKGDLTLTDLEPIRKSQLRPDPRSVRGLFIFEDIL